MTDQGTFTRNIADRDVVFRYPTPAQIIMLRRRLLLMQERSRNATDEEQVDLSIQLILETLKVVESLIVSPEDALYIEEAMLVGKVGHVEVMDVLSMKEEEPKPARKRAAKAAKSPAKPAANRARTKR